MTTITTPPTALQTLADRDIRQRELIPPARLAECRAMVVGVGAIGRQVAIQLAAVGVAQLDLVDFDQVAVENLAVQAYWPQDLGRAKVHATADLCRQINPDLQVNSHADVFRRTSVKSIAAFSDRLSKLVLFCCVDRIDTRRLIWETVRDRVALWVDGRMSAEVVRVLTSAEPQGQNYYGSTLFEPAQAYTGSCTAKSTVYTASIAAGLMLGQFTKWLRDLPVDKDLMLNLLSAELSAV